MRILNCRHEMVSSSSLTMMLLCATMVLSRCQTSLAFLPSTIRVPGNQLFVRPVGRAQTLLRKGPVQTQQDGVSKTSENSFFDAWKLNNNNKNTALPEVPQANSKDRMADLTQFLRNEDAASQIGIAKTKPAEGDIQQDIDAPPIIAGGVALLIAAIITATSFGDLSLPTSSDIILAVQNFFADPTSSLQEVVKTVESMGPLGAFYFWFVYLMADLLAIPAFPLTASAGYLFGVVKGTAIVLAAASIAAAASFIIGRTLLRSYVEEILEGYPEFKKIDNAIGKEGFKLMLLLRLSPIFPFALSNYLYGASKIQFWPYFFGTMLGFTPGTIAYVYGGEIGKALTIGGSSAQPWYIYLGGFALFGAFLKIIADVATGIIEDIQDEEENS